MYHEQLVAPDDPASTADGANLGAVVIEGRAEIEQFARDQVFAIDQVLCFSRNRIMVREYPINLRKKHMVCFGKLLDQPGDIWPEDLAVLRAARALRQSPGSGDRAEFLDICANERPARKFHLEAVMIGGIVVASYLNAALNIFH